jgi:hypothetical protein
LQDPNYRLKVAPRTEIQIRDVSVSPHVILWGGVVTRVSEHREGGAIIGSIDAVDYTELLRESVSLQYTPLAQSTIKQVLTSQTYLFTPSLAERKGGIAKVTVDSISIGSPYSRNLQIGDTVVVNLSDDTYDGPFHKIIAITGAGPYQLTFQQYSNVADSVSSAVTGTVKIPGFLTIDNASGLDSRFRILDANIYDLNTAYKWSPKTPNVNRSVAFATRAADVATITLSGDHSFSVGHPFTITLTNGPTGYAALNGSYTIDTVPSARTFTYKTATSGTVTYGAATGTVSADGTITPTPITGGDMRSNLDTVINPGLGVAYANAGTLDGSGNLTIDIFVKPKNQVDLVTNGLFEGGVSTGWTPGSYTISSNGTTGPYGVGDSAYYSGTDHQDMEMASGSRIAVAAGNKYFWSWRQKASQPNKAHPHIKFYNGAGAVVGNSHGYDICKTDVTANQWERNSGIVVVPATAATMTFVLHHDSFSSTHSVYYTDIQATKITGTFGFSDRPITDLAYWNNVTVSGVDLRDFENPSAPEESGEAANRVYLYAPYTEVDALTGAKKLTTYRNTYDFVQGVWENGGKRIESSIVSNDAVDATLALETARKFFKEKGQALKSFEFEHNSGPLSVGDVVPFIWNELKVAEALVVRKQVGYLVGQEIFYRVQLGGDLAYQRNTLYLVEQRLKDITGDSAYFAPKPSPYAGQPTAGGVVTPAIPEATPGTNQISIKWDYPTSLVNSAAFGGFIVLRSELNLVGTATTAAGGTGSIATLTTSSNHGLLAGDEVVIENLVPDGYNGPFTILSVPALNSFTYANQTTGAQTGAGSIYRIGTWSKASTNEPISGAAQPTAPDVATTSYTDTDLTPGKYYAYKLAAIDVSTSDPIITGYSSTSNAVTPAAVTVDFGNSYSGLGINVPKVIWTVTENTSSFYITSGGTESFLPSIQYPIGQIVYTESLGKLFKSSEFQDNIGTTIQGWTRAAIDKIDVSTSGEVSIVADNITAGKLDAGYVQITNLTVDSLKSGDIELLGNPTNAEPDRLSKLNFKNSSGGVVSYWDKNGLVVKAASDDQKKVYIHDGKIDLINSEGVTTAALDGNGINATSITIGQLPGGSNAIPNSSFELAAFGVPFTIKPRGNRLSSPLLSNSAAGSSFSFLNMTTAVSGVITAVSISSPNVTFTCSPHAFAVGDYVTIVGVLNTSGSGTTILNFQNEKITAVSGTTAFTIQPGTSPSVNTFPTGAVYASSTGKAYRDQIEQSTYGW